MAAGRIARRIGPVAGSSLRYAVVPVGSLAVSWWVVHHASMDLWSVVVAPLVLVQLAVHLSQWGQRDLLLRIFRSGHVDGAEVWRENGWTRLLIAVPLVIAPALMAHLSIPWMLLWAASASVAGSFEPLIVREKRFMYGLLADVAGLVAQFTVLVLNDPLDADTVVCSFAVHNAVRCVGLWWVSGAPRPWPISTDAHLHLVKAIPFVLIGLGGLLATRIDLYAVTALGHGDLVGRYQVVAALFVQFQVIPGLLARPFTTGLLRMEPDALVKAADRSMRWGLLSAAPQALVAGFVLARFFHVDAGWPVLLAGALSVVPAYGYVPLFPVLYAGHKEGLVVLVSFGAAACIALGAWLLVPRWGMAGGLAASAAGQWAQWAGVRVLVQHLRQGHG